MNERTHFFIKNISLTLYSRKGWCWLCVRGELETGTDCYILTPSFSDHSSTSFAFWLGCSTVSHSGPKALCLPLALNSVSCPPIDSNSKWNWAKLSVAPSYIIVSRTPASAVPPLIYTGASLDWRLGRGSIYNNHPVLIFQSFTRGIFFHVRLHPPHTHILQIMLKDNNNKNTKRNYLNHSKKTKS